MKHFLWVLKTTHKGADLDVSMEMAKGFMDEDLSWQLFDLLAKRDEWWAPGKVVELRHRLKHYWKVCICHLLHFSSAAFLTMPTCMCGGGGVGDGLHPLQLNTIHTPCTLTHKPLLVPAHKNHAPRTRTPPQMPGASRDLLMLDIALDSWFRVCVERMEKSKLSGDDLIELAALVLDNASIAVGGWVGVGVWGLGGDAVIAGADVCGECEIV